MYGSSGFRGKGFLFDETEAQLTTERRRFQKAAMGLQDSDDEDDTGNTEDWDSKIEGMFATQKKYKDTLGLAINNSDLPGNETSSIDV